MALACLSGCKDNSDDRSCKHQDANFDHICDLGCSETIGEHTDADKDHACDYGCSHIIGVCADTNKDHICDYGCTETIGEHTDKNGDHVCDWGCSEPIVDEGESRDGENSDNTEGDGKEDMKESLNGKKIIFIGNSYTYYGQTVFEKSQTRLTQKSRMGDRGYFYNLCKLNGAEVDVTNWTFGGHNLEHLFGGSCTANRGCDGEDHKAYLTDPYYDYVVIQPGSGAAPSASFLSDMETVMNFFKAANPDVKFAVLVPYCAYGTIGSTIALAKDFLNGLKTVASMGVTVVDWGGLVMDILNGKVSVPDSNLIYTNNSFI